MNASRTEIASVRDADEFDLLPVAGHGVLLDVADAAHLHELPVMELARALVGG